MTHQTKSTLHYLTKALGLSGGMRGFRSGTIYHIKQKDSFHFIRPNRSGASQLLSLLRTAHDSFPSTGSSILKGHHDGMPRLLYLMKPILPYSPEKLNLEVGVIAYYFDAPKNTLRLPVCMDLHWP